MKIRQIISTFVLLLLMYGCQKLISEPETTLPEAPAALASLTVSSDKVTLSWTDKSTNETGFKIERKTGAALFAGIATVAANITTYSDLSVAPNTTYTYRIASYNATGNSLTYTNEVSVTTRTSTTNSVPELVTRPITSVTGNAAVSGGGINSNGGSAIITKGVVWSTAPDPTIALPSKTTDTAVTTLFTSNLTNLTPNTIYYVRAYATNIAGTGYGNQVIFQTSGNNAILTTKPVDSISATTAMSGGSITNDGGIAITSRGVVWSTSSQPSISLSTKTINGAGIGNFSSYITGLNINTQYYVRAYATNSLGTSYGNEFTFTTGGAATLILSTISLTNRTANSVVSGGDVTSDGGSAVSARGVVWSTTPNPTVPSANKTTNGTGLGAYSSTITGLAPNTTYYVRAYATNASGTAYGNEISISGWMAKNLDVVTYRNGDTIPQVTDPAQWATLTTGAWCYYDNSSSNNSTYGKLYNWYAINDVRGLAPVGWHISTEKEWDIYAKSLGGYDFAGGKMKTTTLWASPNTAATNESGFTGLPGGYRRADGIFEGINVYSGWTSTGVSPATGNVYGHSLSFMAASLTKNSGPKNSGVYVRCIKD